MEVINKDLFYDVLKEPTKENFRVLLQNHLGEEDYLDFKQNWIEKEKIVQHILAIANSGGGCVVFGVAQNDDGSFNTVGLDKLKDKADFKRKVKNYMPPTLKYHIKDFVYENSEYDAIIGKKFQLLIIEDLPSEIPFVCCKDGTIIKNGDIYIRRGTESEKANNYEIDKIIQRKLNVLKVPRKNNLKLDNHLEQLQTLYSELTYIKRTGGVLSGIGSMLNNLYGDSKTEKKDCYPKEDYDDFIVRMIDKKKKRIEEELDL